MIGLVDCNNFFASCERIFEPSLEGRPLAVLSNNDGVVVARSAELKALGVPMGEPYFKLKPLAPALGIVFKSSNYELYADISRRVMTILRDTAPIVEQYSIDEAFMHLTLPQDEDYLPFADKLRQKIRKWVGMPVGIGFAPSRTLAKIASHVAKHSTAGCHVMLKPDYDLLAELPVDEVWGVGRRTAGKLRDLGIRDGRALAAMDINDAKRHFNVCLARTICELNGQQTLLPDTLDEASQTVTCSRTFGKPVVDFAELRESIAYYAGMAAGKMRTMERKAAGCNVYFEYFGEYGSVNLEQGGNGCSVVFRRPSNNTSELLKQILPALKAIFSPGRRYRKSGITFWGLEDSPREQLDMFDKPAPPPIPDKLYKALDGINKDFGKNTIHPLADGTGRPWAMKRTLLSRHYTTCWDEIPLVK